VSLRKQSLTCVFGAAVALSLALTACGSAASNSSSKSTPAGGNTSAGAAASPELAVAQKVVAQYSTEPASISQTDPLPSAPPKGKTFVWLNCDIQSCSNQANGMKAAMAAAGWKYVQINYQSANPATLTAAFNQALTMMPTVVAESGVPPEAGWSSVIPSYKAAGVPIIASYIGDTTLDSTIIANVAGPPVFAEYANEIANWFIADSNGTGKALIQRVDAYPILKSYSDALVADIKAGCPKCDVSTSVVNTAAQAGSNGIVPTVVSALKRDPSIKYLLPCDLEFFDALPSALSAAGLKVKVAGQNPTLASLNFLKAGKFAAAPSHPSVQAGWVIADVAFRYAMHLPIPNQDSGPLPTWLLMSSANFEANVLAEYPTNYESQFAKLWHLG
jgi:ribose transport system substrate-binding protein